MKRHRSLHRLLLCSLLLVLLFVPMSFTSLAAQQTLTAGDKIRVTAGAQRVVGHWVSLDEDRLTLTTQDPDSSVVLPLASLTKLEVSRGQKSRWLEGLGIGFLAGAGIGAAIGGAIDCEEAGLNDEMSCVGLVAAVGAVGGMGLGALVGSAIRTDRWEEVLLDDIRVGPSPATSDGVAVSVTLRL